MIKSGESNDSPLTQFNQLNSINMIQALTYCKFAGEKRFQAYDLNRGIPAGNLIYATMLANTNENRGKLQRLADLNKDQGLTIQLRERGKVVYQTA